MELLVKYFVIVKILGILLAPALIAGYGIGRTLIIKSKNGNTIHKSKCTNNFASYIMIIISLMIFIPFMIGVNSLVMVLIVMIIYLILFIGYFESIIEDVNCGLYEKGIIFKGYSCFWNEIETIFKIPNALRFVHINKGAFDYNIQDLDKDKIISKIENLSNKKVLEYK
jgi:hypothetical protein